MGEWRLILETSGRGGAVGLAQDSQLVASATLDAARRHNRDLAPSVARLLCDSGIVPRDLAAILVSVGPGSYTGLRVGLMSAKALAWATDGAVVPVPTFAALVEALPAEVARADAVADALQGLIYAQSFARDAVGMWQPLNELRIVPAAEWNAAAVVVGPGAALVGGAPTAPTLAGVLAAGLRLPAARGAGLFSLEPLYLRGSSAEEKALGERSA